MSLIIRAGRFFIVLAAITTMFILLLGGTPTEAAPQALVNVKLSGQIQPQGDVNSFTISPDGRYTVYRADAETDEAYDCIPPQRPARAPPCASAA